MRKPDTSLRQGVIANAVNHQTQELEEGAATPLAVDTLFNSELNHDLITWPRQYLEAFLDSDESGRVPLSPEQLQDVLEAAFERDEALAVEFLEEIKAGKGPQSLPGSSLQIVDARVADPEHPYELLFERTNAADFKNLSARIYALSTRGRADAERRETASVAVERKPASSVVRVHDKMNGIDVRKLVALKELGPEAWVHPALTDSGVYRGTVLVETAKDDLDTVPRIGQHVRVRYSDGIGHVVQAPVRNRGKELAR